MAFRFNHSNGQQLSCSLKAEPILIGGEAWIDVDRFCTRGQSPQAVAVNPRASQISLTKSFAFFRKKLRRDSAEGLD